MHWRWVLKLWCLWRLWFWLHLLLQVLSTEFMFTQIWCIANPKLMLYSCWGPYIFCHEQEFQSYCKKTQKMTSVLPVIYLILWNINMLIFFCKCTNKHISLDCLENIYLVNRFLVTSRMKRNQKNKVQAKRHLCFLT